MNKCAGAGDLSPVALVVVGGSLCICSAGRGWCSGGGDLEEDFVPWLRRRGDACSGVDAEPRGLYRSEVLVLRRLQRLVRFYCSRSSSSFVAGEEEVFRSSVVLRFDASPMCWSMRTEVVDFPSVLIPSADTKVTPAPGGGGGGGAAARRQLASTVVLSRLPRDPGVISDLSG